MKKCKRRWKKRVMLGALAAGGAYAVVKTRNAYQGIMKMVEETDDDERKIMEKFAKSYHYIGSAEEFTGAAVGAFCCSLHLEMQNARIEKDCEIELGCMMSSVVIFVPEKIHVVVDVKMTSGVTRWTMQNGLPQGAEGPTLRIHGVARMSSVLVQTLPPTTSEENVPAKEPEETKAPAEDLPSGGPIADDEAAENFDAENDTVRVIKISELDEEENAPEEDVAAEEPVEEASEEISEAEEAVEEELPSEEAEEPTAEEPVEEESEEIAEPEEPIEEDLPSEEAEELTEPEPSDEETTDAPLEEDLDEDDDFAGEDKRKRMSQDQIDAILDRLADEYEERGGEE